MNNMDVRHDQMEGIAIVGMAGRFPGAKSVDQFWANLLTGVESITTGEEECTTVKQERLVQAGGFLEEWDRFDAAFFGITPAEAQLMDPQQRLFLEIAWEGLEHAGYAPEKYSGKIGVFGGTGKNDYVNRILADPSLRERWNPMQVSIANDPDMLASRVSYKLNLKGPSMTVQTACSTSLVAVHQACKSLLLYETDMAIAGGISIRSLDKEGYLYQEGGILSPDGHCRPFDSEAKGTVPGDGAGVVVLKRFEDAVSDGDTIFAVIRGSAVNNDGSVKAGFTAPSMDGQAEVIQEALAIADVHPETIQYVEAHGTATPLGDPIEIEALTTAYRPYTAKRQYCAVGSLKSNMGHLDAAAGVAGLIKTALSLYAKVIPPTLHYEQPNPKIDFSTSPFFVNHQLSSYRETSEPARAAVSSFGIGGTNAHVILEEANPAFSDSSPRQPQLLILSAKTPHALTKMSRNLSRYLREQASTKLEDVAYTLQVGRQDFECRQAFVVSAIDEAVDLLQEFDAVTGRQKKGETPDICFLFPGQGAQYVAMARELYETEPFFAAVVDQCAQTLAEYLPIDVRDVLYPSEGEQETAESQLNQTGMTQPALFVIEYALATLLINWGIRPTAMLGHSVGEYVAATLAGVFSLPDALRIVAERARLMQQLPSGQMVAVHLSEEETRSFLVEKLEIAAVNGPRACVVAGDEQAIAAFSQRLKSQKIDVHVLKTSHAFHSVMMDPILDSFAKSFQGIQLREPAIPYLSNLTGTWITPKLATDPDYWVRHLRHAVRFRDGVKELLSEHIKPLLLEVGPGNALGNFVRQQAAASGYTVEAILSTLRHPKQSTSDVAFLLSNIGSAWVHGVRIDWKAFHGDSRRLRLPLPTYPFERDRYRMRPLSESHTHAKKKDPSDWLYVPTWQRSLPTSFLPQQQETEQSRRLLVFTESYGWLDRLVNHLRERGHDVVTVRMSDHFEQVDEAAFTIHPAKPDHYQALFSQLGQLDQLPTHIIVGWNTCLPGQMGPSSLLEQGLYAHLYLARALGEMDLQHTITLWSLSNNLQDVTGESIHAPERAALQGICRVISQEYPKLNAHMIDFLERDLSDDGWLDAMSAELHTNTDDLMIAYRGSTRWVQTFVPSPRPLVNRSVLRKEGTYVITGASEESGLAYAEYFAKTGKGRLILIGSPDFPEEERWEEQRQVLDSDHSTARIIRRYQALMQQSSAPICFLRADLTNESEVRILVENIQHQFGTINGVIHAHDLRDTGLIQGKSMDEMHAMLQPKLRSTLLLTAALRSVDLDFFLLDSSTLTFLGGLGQAIPSAVGAFFHGIAQAEREHGAPVVCVHWDLWQWDTWLEKQMSHIPALQAQIRQWRKTYGIPSEAGMNVLETVLESGFSQVVVSTRDFRESAASWNRAADNFITGMKQEREEKEIPDREDPQYAAPANEVEEKIAKIWEELLGMPKLSVTSSFFTLGGNSLLAIQIIARLRKEFEVDVPLTMIFEAATIRGLAEAIMQLRLDLTDIEELESLLEEIENLSDAEIKKLSS